ncbi:4'-phosphopantetheinyl transferase [Kitasatospora sp. SolWspMP-SS2h]|uniref:4'-phosphopantetheinyl transferase family protein n=1 Tax=Kitasatospora sp. SolWspMP-SS2h TaxID=1305729 RepID=UPI000DBAAAC1|nr:4'-phosphopantetheinyl transferase superfamily protein [Kitasatospora sp. SolWspMP-SS2h]RAJ43036.1 4'-phosphopantetheinyl transferase [Kitasatospora sp. SolWspMP-SS2h]
MAQPNAVSCRVLWSPVVDRARVRALMSDEERARYGQLAAPEDRARYATARALVRTALGRATGVAPRAVAFSRRCRYCGGPHGKPRVPGAAARFSLSHSGGRVVLAVAEHAEPGVDVERVAAREVDRLAPRVLSERELADFREIRPEDRPAAYHVYWTRKEAVLKAVGRGLSVPLRGLTLAAPGQRAALLSWDGAPGAGGAGAPAIALADLRPGPGYAAALAVETPGRIELAEWDLDGPLDVP